MKENGHHSVSNSAGDFYLDGGRKTLTFWIRTAIKSLTGFQNWRYVKPKKVE